MVMVIRSARDVTVTEMERVFLESICGQGVGGLPPYRTILDISSSRQTCMANACEAGRSSSDAIDSIQLAADEISKMEPLKMRCQWWGDLR